ncbi:hypothetical protein ACHMW6_15475 [Pseudoduganella sp. UC29_106]|uniref:hypothetical protein n=1 Tax=Pseudoduganella sp. UC29_106 TaxID=3374553 RepID=UPI003756D4C0
MKSKYLKWAVIAVFVLAILLVTHQLLAARATAQKAPPHGAGDWATWFGAVGTIAAAGVALWIAGQQERTRRKIELTQANIVAARLVHKLGMARAHVQSFAARFAFHESGTPYLNPYAEAKPFLESPPLIVDHADLVALAGLGGNYAAQLAYVIGMLDDFKVVVRRNEGNIDYWTARPLPPEIAERWEAGARDIADRIAVILRACEAAATIHAPEPTQEELYGPGYGDHDV